jgi:hypothetical protein
LPNACWDCLKTLGQIKAFRLMKCRQVIEHGRKPS